MFRGKSEVEISDITDDSRMVRPGSLFVARRGHEHDGGAYVGDAVRRGAGGVIVTSGLGLGSAVDGGGEGLAWVRMERVDQAVAGRLAERFFGYPSRAIRLIGVTGTNGKTTTGYLIKHLLDRAGCRCGLISTVVNDDGRGRAASRLTTPGAIEFSRLLATMVKNGCGAAVAEVSSHALHQGRVAAVDFDVGVFTNLTDDHLDYHVSMDRYAAAKALLFENLRGGGGSWAVVNGDDPSAARMVRGCRGRVVWTRTRAGEAGSGGDDDGMISGRGGGGSHCTATVLRWGVGGCRVRFDGDWGEVEASLPLVGRYNVSNTLQAVAAASAVKPLGRGLREALEACPSVPGRLEPVRVADPRGGGGDGCPLVLVDYAHTHDALENVLSTVRAMLSGCGDERGIGGAGAKLVVVFGAGGDRDRTKRPKMASVACRLADRVVITSDNPRTEDPRVIIAEILEGVPGAARDRVLTEPDRARAIRIAIGEAGGGDVVLIAGKGHEDYQIIGAERLPFDDRVEAAAGLRDFFA